MEETERRPVKEVHTSFDMYVHSSGSVASIYSHKGAGVCRFVNQRSWCPGTLGISPTMCVFQWSVSQDTV